jgi:hypothetical protein
MIYKLPDTKMEHDPTVYGAETIPEKDIYTLAYPTNRSWTNLAKILPFCANDKGIVKKSILTKVSQGLIGYEASVKFMGYIDDLSKRKKVIPPINTIIEDPSIIKWNDLDAQQGRQIVSGMMQIAKNDHEYVKKVIDTFIFIAENRGSDLCTPYITELIQIASSSHLPNDIQRLFKAYKNSGKMLS